MTLLQASQNMPTNPSDVPEPVFRREARTVVVVDLVESVRLFELDEEGMVRLWQLFVRRTVDELITFVENEIAAAARGEAEPDVTLPGGGGSNS